jgi:hypothetical protein
VISTSNWQTISWSQSIAMPNPARPTAVVVDDQDIGLRRSGPQAAPQFLDVLGFDVGRDRDRRSHRAQSIKRRAFHPRDVAVRGA